MVSKPEDRKQDSSCMLQADKQFLKDVHKVEF
jgi:hypothetical protein